MASAGVSTTMVEAAIDIAKEKGSTGPAALVLGIVLFGWQLIEAQKGDVQRLEAAVAEITSSIKAIDHHHVEERYVVKQITDDIAASQEALNVIRERIGQLEDAKRSFEYRLDGFSRSVDAPKGGK